MRKFLLLLLLILAVVAAPAPGFASDPDIDPFPAGACVKVTVLDPRPICIIIDPDQ